ncbi:MAG: ABC transporter permease, partial [Thermomicrobium sp.]|nr:ABC transporter permease [Thermomicrobium sp.]
MVIGSSTRRLVGKQAESSLTGFGLLRRFAPTILVLLLFVVLWLVVASRTSPYVLPSPVSVFRQLVTLFV